MIRPLKRILGDEVPNTIALVDDDRNILASVSMALEAEGFAANPSEWWHFDYRDWQRYQIQNRTFEELLR